MPHSGQALIGIHSNVKTLSMQELINILNSIHPISAELEEHLFSVLKEKTYTKGTFLLKAGRVSRRINFVEKGLLRSFSVEEEKEYTRGFFAEGEVSIVLASFESQTPSQESVEALEETRVIYLDYEDLQHIFSSFPEADKIGRIVFANAQKTYTDQKNRMVKLSAPERYAWFKNQFPHLVLRVSGKHIASFLGMTEVTLSRIRSQM